MTGASVGVHVKARLLRAVAVVVLAVGCGGKDVKPPDEWQEDPTTVVEVRYIDMDDNGYPDRELRTERDLQGNLKRVRVTDRDGEGGRILAIDECTYDPYHCERRRMF